jgi:hypothetical protein
MELPTWIDSAWTTKEITGGDKKIAARLNYFLSDTKEGKGFADKYVHQFPNRRKAYHPELAALLQIDLKNGSSYEEIVRTLEVWLELKEEFEEAIQEKAIRFIEEVAKIEARKAKIEARKATIDYIVFAVAITLITIGFLYLLLN